MEEESIEAGRGIFDLSDEASQHDSIRPVLRAISAGITMEG